MNPDELLAAASRTPATREGIAELARLLPADDIAPLVDRAVAARDFPAALALLLAQVEAGREVDVRQVVEVAPFADGLEEFLLLVGRARGKRLEAVLDLVESGRFGTAGDVTALGAVTMLLGRRRPPPRLVALVRRLSRLQLGDEDGILLGATAARIQDPWASQLCAHWIERATGEAGRQAMDGVRTGLAGPPSRILPSRAAPTHETGLPVHRAEAKVGRNDPCPCGSGKKYKKCCESTAGPAPAYAVLPDQVGPEKLAQFRPHQLAALDFATLSSLQLIELTRMFAALRLWDQAERALGALAARTDLPEGESADYYRLDLFHDAVRADARESARRQLEALRGSELLLDLDAVALELLRPAAGTLKRLEAVAARALREPESPQVYDLAHIVLRRFPGLGILLARGTLDPRFAADSEEVLRAVEEARDRLLLPPDEPAWSFYDGMMRESLEEAPPSPDGKLAAEAEELRARSQEASGKVAAMARKMREVEAELARERAHAEDAAAAAAASPVDPATLQRLRAKVAEYEGLIADGNRDRKALRRQLADLGNRLAATAERERPTPAEAPQADPEEQEESRPERLPVLVPVFAQAAEEALQSLAPHLSREALRTVAALAGGEAHAWERVKRLRRIADVWSARVGIHHRLLFRLEPDPGRLQVLDFINRKELEAKLQRWR